MFEMTYQYIFTNLYRLQKEILIICNSLSYISTDEDAGDLILYFIAEPIQSEKDAISVYLTTYDDQLTIEQSNEDLLKKATPLGIRVVEDMKIRNRVENISEPQSSHTMKRATLIMNLLTEGALGTALYEANIFIPDDMTETYHWIDQARINLVIADINSAIVELSQ